MIILLLSSLLFTSFWWENPVGSQELWQKLTRLEQQENWQILVGGNEIVTCPVGKRRINLIITKTDSYYYGWGAAAMSPDGKTIAALRYSEPDGDAYLVFIDFPEFLKKGIDIIQVPLPDYEVRGFSWSPDGKKIAFLGRPRISGKHDWQDKETAQMIYLFDLVSKVVQKTQAKNVFLFYPNTWSKYGQLVYEGPRDFVSVYDIATARQTNAGKGMFPSWNSDGTLITFQDVKSRDYYVMKSDGSDKRLLMEVSIKEGNGTSYGPIIWSPDDKFFMYGKQTGWAGTSDDLYIREYATDQDSKICENVDRLWYGSGSWISGKKNK